MDRWFSAVSLQLFDPLLHPQNLAVMSTRCEPIGAELKPIDNVSTLEVDDLSAEAAAIIIQYPNTEGKLYDHLERLIRAAHRHYSLTFLSFSGLLSLSSVISPVQLHLWRRLAGANGTTELTIKNSLAKLPMPDKALPSKVIGFKCFMIK
ncbi:hypothetical protein niasHS_008010 [Heterodera schachtii]|uniref:Glycine cleavage system P-protein N-terminal domain-containing protein n=1 Tax=Heterodera schachtii TaxID=97005 RepID=A0ABD2JCL5_HETSC